MRIITKIALQQKREVKKAKKSLQSSTVDAQRGNRWGDDFHASPSMESSMLTGNIQQWERRQHFPACFHHRRTISWINKHFD